MLHQESEIGKYITKLIRASEIVAAETKKNICTLAVE
jgi:hypothetical protein